MAREHHFETRGQVPAVDVQVFGPGKNESRKRIETTTGQRQIVMVRRYLVSLGDVQFAGGSLIPAVL